MVTSRTAVLTALLRGKTYGLEIIDEVQAHTDGAIELTEGSVYTVLKEMEAEGLVRSVKSEGLPERGGRPRRYYELTGVGRKAANERLGVFRGMLQLAEVV